MVYISMETDISALTYPNKRLYVILLAPEEEITEEERMTIERGKKGEREGLGGNEWACHYNL